MTTMDRFTPSRAPVKRVKAIQLGVWDPEEIVSPQQYLLTQQQQQL